MVLPSHPDMVQWGENIVAAARKSGVSHIVRSSGSLADRESSVEIEELLGITDEYVKNSGVDYTITAPSFCSRKDRFSIARPRSVRSRAELALGQSHQGVPASVRPQFLMGGLLQVTRRPVCEFGRQFISIQRRRAGSRAEHRRGGYGHGPYPLVL